MAVASTDRKGRNGSDAGATRNAASLLYAIRPAMALAFVGLVCFHASFMFSINNNSMRLEVTQPSAREGNASSFELATRESLGFFDDVSDESWWMLKKRYLHVQPNTGNNRLSEDIVKKLYVPEPHRLWTIAYEPEFTCPHEIRAFAHGDGGKWVCDPHRILRDHPNDGRDESCLIYSVGSNGKFQFEEDIQKIVPNCEIHTFDFSGFRRAGKVNFTSLAEDIGVNFHQWGLGERRNFGNFKTFREIVPALGHQNKTIDIMKIDCEECELRQFAQWLKDWRETGVLVRQVLLEVHGVEWPATFHMFRAFSDAGYVIFHKEANFLSRGSCVEYAFVLLSPAFQTP
mmetsp:Transcript_192/g.393  ORF Transcript_192/g.393 Transcript_192/m.393 type:complete len:344 (+) Transcript_192:70-1101(+)|eukprot:CAMPEP_0201118598 /NCGR_PEP_ID=MMETSP0850-20130426/2790_1 /ASSEMBLY_ACC=CAM_ASM_000622 /TAXON_ID=183588 /ORGANISM="Pseudo-nitzschia fraudulenta, Strain WWA7" /LENGTH=343 /DNA_ID=CAMNT_0047383915 /DNA_START=37 /DNA_END=1068 /DNA_ORIENTATION=-